VARFASRLIAANGLEKDYPWELHVIRDDGTVNAFALPGGKIFVYTGLIAHADDEAEVACVLAHELTHVTHRHAAERLTDQYGAQIVEQIALGDRSAIAKVAAQAATQVGFLAFSRHQEAEADEVGIQYVSKTEYDPNGMPRFFEKLQALEGKSPSVVQRFLSDHPATGDRVKTTRELIAKLPPEKQKGESYKERWVAYRTYVCPAGPKATPQTGQPAGNAPAPPPRAK
jgi:predicted Zn-dependent protease